jgi:hypothetical protein
MAKGSAENREQRHQPGNVNRYHSQPLIITDCSSGPMLSYQRMEFSLPGASLSLSRLKK